MFRRSSDVPKADLDKAPTLAPVVVIAPADHLRFTRVLGVLAL
jgi:hypothetical protein